MLEGLWTVVVAGALLLVAANAAILLGAWYERRASAKKDPWLTCTQVLESGTAGAVRPSVILLHGFGGTPSDLRALAERLAARGFRAVVPAIPDQTSATFAYGRGRLGPADYAAWASDLIRKETALSGRPPSLVGFSMGGALATVAAAEHPIDRLVLISPYFGLPAGTRWAGSAARWLRWIVPVLPKLAKGQIEDPDGYRDYETGSYLVSMHAVVQLDALAELARAKARSVSLPVLVLGSERDVVASFAATRELFLGRANARMVVCDRSNHIVTYDFDRELVVAEVLAFLRAPAPPSSGA
jgi:carboxylesterase